MPPRRGSTESGGPHDATTRFVATGSEIRCLPQGGTMCAIGRALGVLPVEVHCHHIGHRAMIGAVAHMSALDTDWVCKTIQGGDVELNVVCASAERGERGGALCVISHGTEDLEAIMVLLTFSAMFTSCAACAMCVAWTYAARRRRRRAWHGRAY